MYTGIYSQDKTGTITGTIFDIVQLFYQVTANCHVLGLLTHGGFVDVVAKILSSVRIGHMTYNTPVDMSMHWQDGNNHFNFSVMFNTAHLSERFSMTGPENGVGYYIALRP